MSLILHAVSREHLRSYLYPIHFVIGVGLFVFQWLAMRWCWVVNHGTFHLSLLCRREVERVQILCNMSSHTRAQEKGIRVEKAHTSGEPFLDINLKRALAQQR